MAETSGFATDLPQSAHLASTMRRAISAAQQRSHRYVTLEHLLLALADDPDAQALFAGLRVDAASVKTAVADTVNRNLATLYTPGQFDLRASYKVERVLQTSSDDARRLNCADLDGAFVLAALAREVDSPAAEIVKKNGLGFSNAVTWLYANRGSSYKAAPAQREVQAPPAQPQPQMQAPPQPQPQMQSREFPPQEREAPRMESPAPQPAPRQKVASPQALAEEEALELELEILDEKPAAPMPPPSKPAPRPQLARAEAAVIEEPQALERRAPIAAPPAPPQMRAPQPAPQPMPRPDMRMPPPETGANASAQRGIETRQRSAPPPMRETYSSDAPPPAPPPAPAQAPSATASNGAAPRRQEAKIPLSRLEEMRVRTPSSAPAPVAPVANVPAKVNRKKSDAKRGNPRRQRGLDAQIGKLVENIPRRMRANVTERIEVRITREETETFTRGLDGRGEPVRHDLLVTSAMSVMLRAPDGGFVIETLSPETQWILEGVERPEDQNYGRWRWAVTPTEKGQRKLQLVIGARTVDLSGMVGETALPEQIISVRVRTNYIRGIKRLLEWIVVMAAGGVVTELGVKIFQHVSKM